MRSRVLRLCACNLLNKIIKKKVGGHSPRVWVNHIYVVFLFFVRCIDVFMSLFAKLFDIDRHICLCFVLMRYMDVTSDLCECA